MRPVSVLLALLLVSSLIAQAAEPQRAPQCGDELNNPELTISVCTRLIEFGGLDRANLAKAYFTRGTEWAGQGQHQRAIADFSVAIELDPKLAGVHMNRALSYSERGEHDLAIEDYTAAIALAPKDAAAYQGRAVEWTVKGDYARALADYEALLGLEPQSLAGQFGRGRVRFYNGDFAGAVSDLQRALAMQRSTYTALWLYLARKRANQPAEKMLAQEAGVPNDDEWPGPIVLLYLGRTRPEDVEAAAAQSNLVRRRERRCEAGFYVAHWHLLRNNSAAALERLRGAEQLCPSTFVEHEGAVAELRRLQTR